MARTTEMTSMTEPEKKRTRQQTLRSASDEQQRASREASGEHLRAGSPRAARAELCVSRLRNGMGRPRRAVSRPSSARGRMSIMSASLTRIAQKCISGGPGDRRTSSSVFTPCPVEMHFPARFWMERSPSFQAGYGQPSGGSGGCYRRERYAMTGMTKLTGMTGFRPSKIREVCSLRNDGNDRNDRNDKNDSRQKGVAYLQHLRPTTAMTEMTKMTGSLGLLDFHNNDRTQE